MSEYKPVREFDGEVGTLSYDQEGPRQIKDDFDKLFTMIDPNKFHKDPNRTPGGIGASHMKPGAVSDAILGARTVDPETTAEEGNSGTITELLSKMARSLKQIKASSNWDDAPSTNLLDVEADITELQSNVGALVTAVSQIQGGDPENPAPIVLVNLETINKNSLVEAINEVLFGCNKFNQELFYNENDLPIKMQLLDGTDVVLETVITYNDSYMITKGVTTWGFGPNAIALEEQIVYDMQGRLKKVNKVVL